MLNLQKLVHQGVAIPSALWFLVLLMAQVLVAQECTTTVPVNVLTYDTYQPIPFQPERLRASVGNSQIVFSKVEKLQNNKSLVLVDISGSMEKTLPFAKRTSQLLIQNLPPGSSMAYGFFNQEPHLPRAFTTEQEELAKAFWALNGYPAKGHTALRDTLHDGLKLFKDAKPGDSILLITDGGENISKIAQKAMEKEVRESGVRIFAIMPLPLSLSSSSSFVSPEEEYGRGWLQDLANKSDGRVFAIYHDWPFVEEKWLQQVAALLQNFWRDGVGGGYLLSMQLPLSLKKPIKWKLRLDTSGDKRLKEASLIYPEKLAPCSLPAAEVH